MWDHALSRESFPWILLGAPAAAWIFAGGTSIPPVPLIISSVTYCAPAAIMFGWPCSRDREALSEALFFTRAGKYSLIFPEVLLPVAAGMVPAMIMSMIWTGGDPPWQLWTVIVFSSVTAFSITFLLQHYLGTSGSLLNLLAFLSQASTASWASSSVFQLMVPHGYVLWTIRWISGSGAAFHGDVYAFFAVLEGTGLLILTVKLLGRTLSCNHEPHGAR